MSRIGSKNTLPERRVRSLLHSLGYRYRLHGRHLPGTPDLVFSSRKCVIFVHGCFWHGHGCGRGFRPAKNAAFWATKLAANHLRDQRASDALRSLGWRVMTIWECETNPNQIAFLQNTLATFLGPPRANDLQKSERPGMPSSGLSLG